MVPNDAGEFDSAVCDTGVSRWTNFYIEGLNISASGPPSIDGIYYDVRIAQLPLHRHTHTSHVLCRIVLSNTVCLRAQGILFPRDTLLRIRRVLSATKGDQALTDLHQSNFSQVPLILTQSS